MKNIRGITPSSVIVADDKLNVFVARFSEVDVVLRQPRKKDSGKSRVAWNNLSGGSRQRYKRKNVDQQIYDMNYRCKLPLYRGEVPGFLPLIMEVDDAIVGFVDIFFKYGTEFPRFNIEPTDTAMNASIGVLDKYQGLGFGTAYSYLTDEVGRHFGMNFILGTTYIEGGMFNIRVKDKWEVIRKYRAPSGDNMVDHRKRLS